MHSWKVSNVLSKITVDTANNTVLASGQYTIKVESFGSPDGIYYGVESSDTAEVNIELIESSYGLKVTTDEKEKIVDKDSGKTENGNNEIKLNIEYSSGLENPNLTISLYRRDYSNIYSQIYEQIDLNDYVTNAPTNKKGELEYAINESPQSQMSYFFNLRTNLTTGTYKFVVKLYDSNEFIGEAYEYMIIK